MEHNIRWLEGKFLEKKEAKKSKKKNRTIRMNKEDVMTGKRELNQIYGMKFGVYILIRSRTNKHF